MTNAHPIKQKRAAIPFDRATVILAGLAFLTLLAFNFYLVKSGADQRRLIRELELSVDSQFRYSSELIDRLRSRSSEVCLTENDHDSRFSAPTYLLGARP